MKFQTSGVFFFFGWGEGAGVQSYFEHSRNILLFAQQGAGSLSTPQVSDTGPQRLQPPPS